MVKIFVVALICCFCSASYANDLIKYYNGDINLTDTEIKDLCDQIKNHRPSNYLLSLAHYQSAVILRKEKRNFEAYESYDFALISYDFALIHLNGADTLYSYLHSAILRNQGIILKQYGLYTEAAMKQEAALPLSYQYSKRRGISTKYNLAWTLAAFDPEKALPIFFEVLEEAEEEGLDDRQARILNEIGALFFQLKELDYALKYFKKAQLVAKSSQVKADVLHQRSSIFYYQELYSQQEELLLETIAYRIDDDRFWALRDLGECYLMQNKIEEAKNVLFEAEGYYDKKPLYEKNVWVFEWLIEATGDSSKYAYRAMLEYKKLAQEKLKLEALLKRQAMKNFIDKLEIKREKQEKERMLTILIISGFSLSLFVVFLWQYRKYKIRKSIEQSLVENNIVDDPTERLNS